MGLCSAHKPYSHFIFARSLWENDRVSGQGRLVYGKTGNVYEGEWKSDMRHGQGTLLDRATNTRWEGRWFNDRRHG